MSKTVGEPAFTSSGRDVLAFHLHRYLAHWLAKTNTTRVWVTVGWEGSDVDQVTVEVGRQQSVVVDVGWTFDALCDAFREGGRIELAGDGRQRHAVPIVEGDCVLAFVVLDTEIASPTELQVHASEALHAARRNGVRLLFDECDNSDMKAVLYDVLDHLPEWTGCDVAAACVLANSLDALTIDAAAEADFYVMAERLYCSDDANATRLVGLSIDTRDEIRTVVDAAIERLAASPGEVVRFESTPDGYVDDRGEPAVSIGSVSGRPADGFSIVAPIVAERDEEELIGLLCLAFSGTSALPASVIELLGQLGTELGWMLRHSSLYTLSASRLRLVRQVRRLCEDTLAGGLSAEDKRARIVSGAVDLVQTLTGVPAFSIGWVAGAPRTVRYAASYGWSDFDTIELLVDVPDDEHADSGVSALAIRLGRSVILAGGRADGDQEFKNFLWVHEASGQIVDARAPGNDVAGRPGWTRLGAYYKPARKGAYATVAHPVMFAGQVLGVVALEVDRDTDWTWWAGYSAQLLWELVGSELAFAFWAIERELHG